MLKFDLKARIPNKRPLRHYKNTDLSVDITLNFESFRKSTKY